MKIKIIVRVITLVLFGVGLVFAFLLVYSRSINQEPVPELVEKDTILGILKKGGNESPNYDVPNMELLHIHKTGQVYFVDQKTLKDTSSLYQENLPNFPHDMYIWRIPFTNVVSWIDSDSTIVDASSGAGLGFIYPRADCPLSGIGKHDNGEDIEYIVYYATLSDGKISYIDPTLKGTFRGNPDEFRLINMTQNYSEVLLMLQKYNQVCVDSFPTNGYLKTDPHFPTSKNDVEYLAMGMGTNNQIILIEKIDSENKNIGKILYCGTDASPIYNPNLEDISSCFNSTSSKSP